jgi:hypothetical protein
MLHYSDDILQIHITNQEMFTKTHHNIIAILNNPWLFPMYNVSHIVSLHKCIPKCYQMLTNVVKMLKGKSPWILYGSHLKGPKIKLYKYSPQ